MTYIIKCISGIHSRADFLIKGGQELEVSKEIYDYFNNRFGASGNFNFITKGVEKKVTAKKVETKVEDVKEVKVTKKVPKEDK